MQLDSVNIQGLHNLCVVYVERGKLAQAHSCLEHAHQLAPTEDYILRHLQIVQTRISKLKTLSGYSKEKEIAFTEFDPKEFGGGENDNTEDVVANNDGSKLIEFMKTQNPIEVADNNRVNQLPMKSASTTTTASSTSTQSKKPQTPPTQPISQHNEGPIFIDADKITSKIDNEYRPSNSGRPSSNDAADGSNRARYHLQHAQVTHRNEVDGFNGNNKIRNPNHLSSSTRSRSFSSSSKNYNKKLSGHKKTSQSMPDDLEGDRDDPSSGMS